MRSKKALRLFMVIGLMLALILTSSFQACAPPAEEEEEEEEEEPTPSWPVPEEVISSAVQFADLDRVLFAAQVRENSTHTNFYEVRGVTVIDEEEREVLLAVDEELEVVRFARLCPRYATFSTDVRVQPEQVIGICDEFLAMHELENMISGDYVLIEEPTLYQTGPEYYYHVGYAHTVDDVPVGPDFITFDVDAQSGDVITYSKVHHDVTVSTVPTIDSDGAISRARSFLDTQGYLDSGMLVLSTPLETVYPNNYFGSWLWEWTEDQALVWNVKFVDGGEGLEPAVDVWVDAHTGEIQGGEVYENPMTEMYGIYDQWTDVTGIWLEPLQEMQYDTTQTYTWGGANPPSGVQAQVVSGIANPDKYLFMLQTHGGLDGTTPYAALRYAPNPEDLYPADIPSNDLRWALVSCCHSGDDNSPDDFKTQFIEEGALLFTGYVGSINPDPYEQKLAYYLEQGYAFNNAHSGAVAATNPTFDIVYRWSDRVYCYNQIRLAPLFVDVSKTPAADVTPGDTFQMLVDVLNLETALHDLASNVMAELILPSGFTIISGANPQSLGNLPYGSGVTASWDVQVNSATSPGTYIFDAIVWSDNLGVEVDDPDNPYHKYVVTVIP